MDTSAPCEPERRELNPPPGYQMTSQDGLKIVFREGYAESFDGFTLPDTSSGEHGGANRQGRGELIPMSLAGASGERALVRRCLRGGLLGRLLKDLYLGGKSPRPLRELEVSQYARSQGIPTPEILAVAIERVGPFFYRGAVVVREISPGSDLQAELLAIGCNGPPSQMLRKRRLISLLGELVAKMHAAGIWHADLHLKNVLAADEGGEPKLHLLDLDAASVRNPLPDLGARMNLLRLYRSVEKVNRINTIITRTDRLRFARAYAAESSQSVRRLMERINRLLPIWRLKWKLSDLLGV